MMKFQLAALAVSSLVGTVGASWSPSFTLGDFRALQANLTHFYLRDLERAYQAPDAVYFRPGHPECPDSLENTDIKLRYAKGVHIGKDTSDSEGRFHQTSTHSSSEVHDMELVFYVHRRCGIITVQTKPILVEVGKTTSGKPKYELKGWEWDEPEYEIYSQDLREYRDKRDIDLHENDLLEAGDAYKLAMKAVSHASHSGDEGFSRVELYRPLDEAYKEPIYEFDQDDDELYVWATSGQKAPSPP